MDNSDHIYPRADRASREVDSFVLASALDHIAKVAAKSHTQTRRIRWIQARAENALAGKEHCDLDIDLPRRTTSPERLQKRLGYVFAHLYQYQELLQYLFEKNPELLDDIVVDAFMSKMFEPTRKLPEGDEDGSND